MEEGEEDEVIWESVKRADNEISRRESTRRHTPFLDK